MLVPVSSRFRLYRLDSTARLRRRRRCGRNDPSPIDHTPMTDLTASQMRVECTDCEFSQTLVCSDGEWPADDVTEHAERTGHRLRVMPVDR